MGRDVGILGEERVKDPGANDGSSGTLPSSCEFPVVLKRPRRANLFDGLTFRPAEVDVAEAGDRGDEGWLEFVAEAAHFGDGEFERGGHVLAGHVARGEDKLADGVFFESAFFEEIVTDAFVRGQQDPALRTYEGQPSLIENSSIEVG